MSKSDVVFAQNDVMAYSMYRYCCDKDMAHTRFIGVDARVKKGRYLLVNSRLPCLK